MPTAYLMALDRALCEVELPQPDPARWDEQLLVIARQLRAAMRRQDLVPASAGLPPGGAMTLRFHDRVLAIMRSGGAAESRSVAGLYSLWLIVTGLALEEARDRDPDHATLRAAQARYLAGSDERHQSSLGMILALGMPVRGLLGASRTLGCGAGAPG